MTAFDFSPLFRTSVGFDRLARLAEATLSQGSDSAVTAWPPYNIEKTSENNYAITLAVAGFAEDDLSIEVTGELLSIRGGHRDENVVTQDNAEGDEQRDVSQFLHRGIAARSFMRRFQLADHMRVTGASLENGLLTVTLVREVPESSKPRQIPITTHTVPALSGAA